MHWSKFFQEYGAAFRLVNVEKGYRKIPIPPPSAMFTEHKLDEHFIQLCPWEGEYLFAVARHAKLGIVEIGRFKGGSTFLLANAVPKSVPIYSIDLEPQDDEKLKRLFEATSKSSLKRVRLIVGDSQKGCFPEIGPYDLLFIDGDHSYQGCSADIANWYGGLARNGHMLFHDSHKLGVQDAIADFMGGHPKAQVVTSPFMGSWYWQNAHGSLSHVIKRERQRGWRLIPQYNRWSRR
ncbi:MAG: class I SAM-dependent methyltransferase [Methyloceanibacter sp.]|nr:class I SAM-dependent methyltransferase [Methyloceanibacter sp.]